MADPFRLPASVLTDVSGVVAYLGLPEFDGMFPLGFREMLLLNEGSDIICVRVSESLNERFLKQLSICEQQAGSVCISNLTVDHSTRSLNTTAETDMKFQVCYVCKQFGLLEGVRFSLQNDTAFRDNVKSVVMLRKELSIQQYMKPFEKYNIKIEPNESIEIEPNECATAEPPCKKARNDEVVGSSSANNASPPASWVKEQFSVMIKGHPQATVSSMEDVD